VVMLTRALRKSCSCSCRCCWCGRTHCAARVRLQGRPPPPAHHAGQNNTYINRVRRGGFQLRRVQGWVGGTPGGKGLGCCVVLRSVRVTRQGRPWSRGRRSRPGW
jgi:hypothetical protein